jgi:nitrite reductase/ring-hydroxylating ferredoxin subunit
MSAYSHEKGTFRDELTRVARGTPMGELLRRYWHAVALSSDATETPKMVQALGEELLLFRDRAGRCGLMYPRCVHRGASLFYGRVEDRGIRCCYHGWLYDVSGQCLEQPCEPRNGAATARPIQQPSYPVRERYGLVFAYMGPQERQPLLPRYNLLEQLGEGESLEADDSSIGSGGPAIVPCNWLQHFENVMDPFHVPVLHGSFSGAQFTERMNLLPEVSFESTPRGIKSAQRRKLANGRTHLRVTEAVLPTLRVVANPQALSDGPCSLIGWILPLDDTHFRIYSAGRVASHGALRQIRARFNGRLWSELTEEEHQRFPGDYEAQLSQGPITLHSEEHLVSSDRGIALLRRLLERQLEALARGENPIGVQFAPASDLVELEAGTAVVE